MKWFRKNKQRTRDAESSDEQRRSVGGVGPEATVKMALDFAPEDGQPGSTAGKPLGPGIGTADPADDSGKEGGTASQARPDDGQSLIARYLNEQTEVERSEPMDGGSVDLDFGDDDDYPGIDLGAATVPPQDNSSDIGDGGDTGTVLLSTDGGLDPEASAEASDNPDDYLRTVKLDAGALFDSAPPPVGDEDTAEPTQRLSADELPAGAASDDEAPYLNTVKLDAAALAQEGLGNDQDEPTPTPPGGSQQPDAEPEPVLKTVKLDASELLQSAPAAAARPPRPAEQERTEIRGTAGTPDAVVGWVVIIAGPGKGQARTLRAGVNHIGRAPDNDVPLYFGGESDGEISRRDHAQVIYDATTHVFTAQHGKSRNLTYLNDEALLNPVTLKAHDRLRIGATTLVFVPFCGSEFHW